MYGGGLMSVRGGEMMLKVNLFRIAFYAPALLICVTSLLFTFTQKRTDKAQNKTYIIMVSIVALNALSLMIGNFAEPYRDNGAAFFAIQVCEFSYFLLHTALCPAFYYYVSCVCGASVKLFSKKSLIYASLFLITEAAVLINPIFHWVYYFDTDREFTRNWAEVLIYIAAGVYFILSMIKLLFSWNALTAKRKVALIYFFAIVILGVSIQYVKIDVKCELFSEALALMGVMIAIESEDDRIDIDTGFYNRRALQTDLNSYIVNKRKLQLICIKITNAEIVQKATGSENADIISDIISDFLKTLVPRYYTYSTNPDTVLLTLPDSVPENGAYLAKEISIRFEEPWEYGSDIKILLNAVVIAAAVPDRIKTAADAIYMADCPVPANNDKSVLMGDDLDYLLRRAAVEHAVSTGLEKNNFEVYYQPTYYLKDRRLYGAEALIRLHDDELGNLYPDEFIPVAEQMGLIDAIDEFVLREVCKFIKSGIPKAKGMETLNVNLSVMECMQPGFVERINGIADEYGVDKSFIDLEITESIDAGDYKRLSEIVSQLKKDGFRFAMDDYGTGYSNMQSIFSLDFDVVKIDKSILWSAEESELGKIILENSVRMIQQMNREILVEGVETIHQIDMLDKLSVNYLQGYYFSKPIPKSEFVELLEKQKTMHNS